MGVHHIALATKDIGATHAFYTEAMGFELVKGVCAPTASPGGWAKHLFYDTGGDGLIAFWDLHDEGIGDDWSPAISTGLGLPSWVNHLAFTAGDLGDLATRRQRWLDQGITVMEIDHGFCVSIYTRDPNGVLVEWCCDTRPLDERDRGEALEALKAERPRLEAPPTPVVHRPPSRGPAATPAPEPVPAT